MLPSRQHVSVSTRLRATDLGQYSVVSSSFADVFIAQIGQCVHILADFVHFIWLCVDAYLSPEMKSTGEAIGYDDKLNRALYKALTAAGMKLQNYGTVFATISDADKAEALPLIRRFYNLGFNIEATSGTAKFLKDNGIRTHVLKKISEGSMEIRDSIRQGHIAYVINTSAVGAENAMSDGVEIRKYATESNVTMFTSLDTVRVLLDVLEETTLTISTIDA